MVSRIHFTPNSKVFQKINNFGRKIRPLTQKMIYFLFYLQIISGLTDTQREREKEQEERVERVSLIAPQHQTCWRDRAFKITLSRSRRQDHTTEIAPSSSRSNHRSQDRPVKIAPLIFVLIFKPGLIVATAL